MIDKVGRSHSRPGAGEYGSREASYRSATSLGTGPPTFAALERWRQRSHPAVVVAGPVRLVHHPVGLVPRKQDRIGDADAFHRPGRLPWISALSTARRPCLACSASRSAAHPHQRRTGESKQQEDQGDQQEHERSGLVRRGKDGVPAGTAGQYADPDRPLLLTPCQQVRRRTSTVCASRSCRASRFISHASLVVRLFRVWS